MRYAGRVPELPLVSIVTPSYNMAEYLTDTIESVLSQDYPNIEYIVMDGGSTDGSPQILEKYKDRLRYVSEPDSGAPDAINRGFQMAHGEIFAWLNADDTYLPGAVSTAMRHLAAQPEAAAVHGQGYWVDSTGAILRQYPTQACNEETLGSNCVVCQPACFLRGEAFRAAGGLDARLQHTFDYDLWIRMARRYRFACVPEYLATCRMHSKTKTLGDRPKIFRENFRLLKRHYGYVPFHWIYGYVCYRLDKRDQFYEPLRPSFVAYFLSLPLGWYYNWRWIRRYSREWFAVMSYAGLLRMWNRSALAKALGMQSRG